MAQTNKSYFKVNFIRAKIEQLQSSWAFRLQRYREEKELKRFQRRQQTLKSSSSHPKIHTYANYSGPWIENYFWQHWKKLPDSTQKSAHYVEASWIDLRISLNWDLDLYQQAVKEFFAPSPKNYAFTVSQSDKGIECRPPFPLLIYSAGGVGDIPIPLLKGRSRARGLRKTREIHANFTVHPNNDPNGLRKDLQAKCDRWGWEFQNFTSQQGFQQKVETSWFTLAPRGFGPTSFRFYEALALRSIPVYLWEDVRWVPYKDELDWDRLALIVERKQLENLPAIISKLSTKRREEMLNYRDKVYEKYFTFEAVCKWIAQDILKRVSLHKKEGISG